jgi:small-conductance mechanosensitive channel
MPAGLSTPYWDYLFMGGLMLGAVIIGLVVQWLFLKIVLVFSRKTDQAAQLIIVRHLRWPLRIMGPLFFIALLMLVYAQLDYSRFDKQTVERIQAMVPTAITIFTTLFIFLFSWVAIKIIAISIELAEYRFKKTRPDSLRTRKIFTQLAIIKRVASVVIMFIAGAVILLQFKEIASLGTTILASAGVIGIIVGIAAQRSIATLLAGVQIAFSQPIRIDDVVFVENEWGVIEEITLTCVVVRCYDRRRLILPITYFIEKPFQNWTRKETELTGFVMLSVDYASPVAEIRARAQEIITAHPLWDGKVFALQVSDSKENSLELRVILSAQDSVRLMELRCQVREALVSWLATAHPDCLPRIRLNVESAAPPPATTRRARSTPRPSPAKGSPRRARGRGRG